MIHPGGRVLANLPVIESYHDLIADPGGGNDIRRTGDSRVAAPDPRQFSEDFEMKIINKQ